VIFDKKNFEGTFSLGFAGRAIKMILWVIIANFLLEVKVNEPKLLFINFCKVANRQLNA